MKRTKAIDACLPYTVIRDKQEKAGHGWMFHKSETSTGTVVRHLPTGDYTLVGFEHILCIERKGTLKEFADNLHSKAFEGELERMLHFPVSVVILEFPFEDLVRWPDSAPCPPRVLPKHLQVRGALLSRFWELSLKYPSVQFTFAGTCGHEAASSLFKRVIELHASQKRGA